MSYIDTWQVAEGEGADFLPVGGAFENPRVRDPHRQEAFREELNWADYVLGRFIQTQAISG